MKVRYLLFAALALGSCDADLRDLCYNHNHAGDVNLVFDWQKAPQISAKGMTALFYNQDLASSEPERYDFSGNQGGKARLSMGTYNVLAYNNDTETILLRGTDSPKTLEAYTRYSSIEEGTQLTRSGMPRGAAEDEPVILEPDPISCKLSDPFSIEMDQAQTITLQPELRYRDVTITITDVPNLQYTSQFGASLSGLAPSVNMATGKVGEGCATEAFTGLAIDGYTLVFHVRIFGHCPDVTNQHILTIYAILADDSKWYYSVDVTEQMHDEAQNPDEDEEINIQLQELPLPKPIVNGSGFQPTVDGWQSVEINVTMDD